MTVRTRCILFALVVVAGCGVPDAENAAASAEAAHPGGADTAAPAHEGAAGPAAAEHDGDTLHAAADHDAMALRPIMQQLGTAMAALQHALWLEDAAQVEAQAAAIAAHAHISAAENARVERVLGAELGAFQQADETVHQAALRMHEAARARDTEAMLEHLAAVQRGCVACHSRFRERLRTTD